MIEVAADYERMAGPHSEQKPYGRLRDVCTCSIDVPVRRIVVLLLCLAPFIGTAQAQSMQSQLPEDIFSHLYWSVKGQHAYQELAAGGLDYVGRLSPQIPNAFTMVEDGLACLIFNQFKGDTICRARLPGQKIFRCNLNGDAFADYVCWDNGLQKVTVLYGTADPTVFRAGLTLVGTGDNYKFLDGRIVVGDCDGDSLDDLIISDAQYRDSTGNYVGRIQFFRGGDSISAVPTQELIGKEAPAFTGGLLALASIRKTGQRYFIESTHAGDSISLRIHPCGLGFHLSPVDTAYLDVTGGGSITSHSFVDIDGDSIADAVIGGLNAILVFRGGDTILSTPTLALHKPFGTSSATFGKRIIDLGNASSLKYHTILVSDPEASSGGFESGAVFLYNIGTALRDACVGYAAGPFGDMDLLGEQIILLGDIDNDGLIDFAASGRHASDSMNDVGALYIFRGSANYVGVIEPHITADEFDIVTYPNPASAFAHILVRRGSNAHDVSHAQVVLQDMLGRIVGRYDLVQATTEVLPIDVHNLPTGAYFVRIMVGTQSSSNLLQVVH
jgi:hypothetical protein